MRLGIQLRRKRNFYMNDNNRRKDNNFRKDNNLRKDYKNRKLFNNRKLFKNRKLYNNRKRYSIDRKAILFYLTVSILLFSIVGGTLNKLNLYMAYNDIVAEGINYDSFRQMNVAKKQIKRAIKQIEKAEKKQNSKYDPISYFTTEMLLNKFDLLHNNRNRKKNLEYLINRLEKDVNFNELNQYYKAILSDIRVFPVKPNADGTLNVTYTDTWNAHRSYGGNRRHEGSDLMPMINLAGIYKIISVSDGVVEKLGWLDQGGYRVGIRSENGAYFYYAHLDSYAEGLSVGDYVKAGDFLGYMGDSGYGEEGTKGEFQVHLHFGIYVDAPFGEISVNPYWILKYLE